jgi:hypothetical protein
VYRAENGMGLEANPKMRHMLEPKDFALENEKLDEILRKTAKVWVV